jgi:hypothetical protein
MECGQIRALIFQELQAHSCPDHKVMIVATALTVNFLPVAPGRPSCARATVVSRTHTPKIPTGITIEIWDIRGASVPRRHSAGTIEPHAVGGDSPSPLVQPLRWFGICRSLCDTCKQAASYASPAIVSTQTCKKFSGLLSSGHNFAAAIWKPGRAGGVAGPEHPTPPLGNGLLDHA